MNLATCSNLLWGFQIPFLLFIGINGVIVYTAFRFLMAFFYSPRISVRGSTLLLLVIVQIIFAELIAGLLGILTFPVVVVEHLVIFGLALLITKRRPEGYQASWSEELGLYVKRAWELSTWSWPHRILSFSVFCFSAGLFVLNFQTPPFYVDVINYHFPIVAMIYQTKSLLTYPTYIPQELFFYPINGNLLALWTLLPWGNDFWARAFQAPFPFLIMLTFYSLMRRFQVDAPRAFLFSLFPVVFPWILMRSLLNRGVDEIFIYSFMGLVYFLVVYSEKPDFPRGILVAISGGFFLGVKYLAISFLPGFIFIWFYLFYRRRQRAMEATDKSSLTRSFLQSTLMIFLGLILLGGMVYLRNWILMGTPVFPAFSAWAAKQTGEMEFYTQMPQFLYKLKDWLHGSAPPFSLLLVMALSFALAIACLIKRWKNDPEASLIKAIAGGLIIIIICYTVYPFMNHNRFILGIFFTALALALSVFGQKGILTKAGLLWWFSLGGIVLLLANLRFPLINFYDSYSHSAFWRALIGGGLITLIVYLWPKRVFNSVWTKLSLAGRTIVVLLAAVLISFVIAFTAYRQYQQQKWEYYAAHFNPFYRWLEEASTVQGRNILGLDMGNYHYLFYGTKLQNHLFKLSSFEDREWSRKGFYDFLRSKKIDWIFYQPVEIRSRRDIYAIQRFFHETRDLSSTQIYYPPQFAWMQEDGDHFALVKQTGDIYLYQFYPEAQSQR